MKLHCGTFVGCWAKPHKRQFQNAHLEPDNDPTKNRPAVTRLYPLAWLLTTVFSNSKMQEGCPIQAVFLQPLMIKRNIIINNRIDLFRGMKRGQKSESSKTKMSPAVL